MAMTPSLPMMQLKGQMLVLHSILMTIISVPLTMNLPGLEKAALVTIKDLKTNEVTMAGGVILTPKQ